MMTVSMVFLPNLMCSLCVAFSIISIELGVLGFMSLWGVSLDSITMIQLIMCIGFSVDFSAHISYAYLAASGCKPEDRVKESLYALGLPIVQGALSTILGVSSLLFASSYMFQTFFKTVLLVITFGAFHALFLLPVLLSIFGPGSGKQSEDDNDQNSESTSVRKPDFLRLSAGNSKYQSTTPSSSHLSGVRLSEFYPRPPSYFSQLQEGSNSNSSQSSYAGKSNSIDSLPLQSRKNVQDPEMHRMLREREQRYLEEWNRLAKPQTLSITHERF